MRKSSKLDFAIIGLGPYGSVPARKLETRGYSVLGVDIDPAAVSAIANKITSAVIADAADEYALAASTRMLA